MLAAACPHMLPVRRGTGGGSWAGRPAPPWLAALPPSATGSAWRCMRGGHRLVEPIPAPRPGGPPASRSGRMLRKSPPASLLHPHHRLDCQRANVPARPAGRRAAGAPTLPGNRLHQAMQPTLASSTSATPFSGKFSSVTAMNSGSGHSRNMARQLTGERRTAGRTAALLDRRTRPVNEVRVRAAIGTSKRGAS